MFKNAEKTLWIGKIFHHTWHSFLDSQRLVLHLGNH